MAAAHMHKCYLQEDQNPVMLMSMAANSNAKEYLRLQK